MQGSTFALSIFVLPFKAEIFIPLLSLAIQLAMHELSKEALFFSDHRSLSVREAVLEESIVIEGVGEELAVSFALQVDDFASVEGSIRHGGELILLDVLSIVIAQILYLLTQSSALQLVHEVVGVDRVEFALLRAHLALTHC